MNVSSSSIKAPNWSIVRNSSIFNQFLFVEWHRHRFGQLTPVRRGLVFNVNKAKSFLFKPKFFIRKASYFIKCCINRILNCILNTIFSIKLLKSQRDLNRTLLVRAGVERNPGPQRGDGIVFEQGFKVISQNCRGLTNRANAISILRKLYGNVRARSTQQHRIACLQETHCIDQFA